VSTEPFGARPPEPSPATEVVRTYLVALAFRFRHVTGGVPEHFGAFEAGSGVRTPTAIVRHMTGLILWVLDQYAPGSKLELAGLPFDEECARFLDAVRDLDRVFAESAAMGATAAESALAPRTSELTFEQLWRGPLTDAMTHVGQLATLRRLAGDPVDRVRYWQVDMPPLDER